MWKTLKNAAIYIFDGEDNEENTDDEMKQRSSTKGGKIKGIVSQKNLMSRNDNDDAASPNQSRLV